MTSTRKIICEIVEKAFSEKKVPFLCENGFIWFLQITERNVNIIGYCIFPWMEE